MSKKEMIEVLRANGRKVDGRASESKVTEMYEDMLASQEASRLASEAMKEEEMVSMDRAERANRVTVQTTECGYEARFYRTHKLVCKVQSAETGWVADADANSTTNRESFRNYVCENASSYGVLWNPAKQGQAWERKHNTYMTDEEVAEDTLTLVTPVLERLASKGKHEMWIDTIEVTTVVPKESNLTYVEDGRYTKSGAWCVADIELEIDVIIGNLPAMRMVYSIEMKSGQICKPKMTIAEWNSLVDREMELNGIEVAEQTA